MSFRFDPTNHKYWLGPKHLGGFTEVFKALGLVETQYYTEEGRDRGLGLHLLCQAYDEGREIDETKIEDKRMLARFRAYKRFREETGFKPRLIEAAVFSERHMIACTIDRTGIFPGSPGEATIDLKGGAKAKWHPFQTAWQNICLDSRDDSWGGATRFALYLKDTGRYSLDPHEDAHDFEVVKAVALTYHTKRRLS